MKHVCDERCDGDEGAPKRVRQITLQTNEETEALLDRARAGLCRVLVLARGKPGQYLWMAYVMENNDLPDIPPEEPKRPKRKTNKPVQGELFQ